MKQLVQEFRLALFIFLFGIITRLIPKDHPESMRLWRWIAKLNREAK